MATYEGMGYCDIREYHSAFDARLQVEQLTRGEVYVARFRLDDLKKGYRILGRIGMEIASSTDPARIDLQMLDDDMQPLCPLAEGFMTDGLWNPHEPMVLRNKITKAAKSSLTDACFSEY